MKERIKVVINWDDFFDELFYFILKLIGFGFGLIIILSMLAILVYMILV